MRVEKNIMFPLLEFWFAFVRIGSVRDTDAAKYYESGIPIHAAHTRQIFEGRETVSDRFPDLDAARLGKILNEPGILLNIVLFDKPSSICGSFVMAEKGLDATSPVRKTFFIPHHDARAALTTLCVRHHKPLPANGDSILVSNRKIGFQRVTFNFKGSSSDLFLEE